MGGAGVTPGGWIEGGFWKLLRLGGGSGLKDGTTGGATGTTAETGGNGGLEVGFAATDDGGTGSGSEPCGLD